MTFISEDPRQTQSGEEESQYITAFGITFTPTVLGIICGVAGLLGALYIFSTMILPQQETNQQLKTDKETKEAQISQLKSGETQKEIQKLQETFQDEEMKKAKITALFSDEKTLDTLLLDLNNFIQANNATLVSFTPDTGEPLKIDDGSLGSLVNGKLKRKSIKLEIEGDYQQIQAIMREIERYQPLLLVNDFNSQVNESISLIDLSNPNAPRIISPPPKLTTTLRLDAILPLTEEELQAAQAAAQPAQPGQAPAEVVPAP
jgi:Tfp pilus assembly protein PilN